MNPRVKAAARWGGLVLILAGAVMGIWFARSAYQDSVGRYVANASHRGGKAAVVVRRLRFGGKRMNAAALPTRAPSLMGRFSGKDADPEATGLLSWMGDSCFHFRLRYDETRDVLVVEQRRDFEKENHWTVRGAFSRRTKEAISVLSIGDWLFSDT